MPGSHVLVERVDGSDSGKLPVLLVHVVGSRARVVSDPDTEVLDLERLLLVDLYIWLSYHNSSLMIHSLFTNLVEGNDLSSALLDLPELLQKVPESGLGHNLVHRKQTHAVELWCRLGLRREAAADNLVFMKTAYLTIR